MDERIIGYFKDISDNATLSRFYLTADCCAITR